MGLQSSRKNKQTTTAWIAALAVSITCCSILFLVFADYLIQINKNIAVTNMRLATMEENETQLLREIVALHHVVAPAKAAHGKNQPASPGAPAEPQE